jgi:hypothetical protein
MRVWAVSFFPATKLLYDRTNVPDETMYPKASQIRTRATRQNAEYWFLALQLALGKKRITEVF